ncbi:GNAT family N-acetyltransferase [Paenibacillus polymyxa]|uniref:GNAT family N-acetyltransferase n=1 Tax=Paenibacillus TaxID=44249 RepID=UPI00077C5AFB|nr:GNAT family N-acetyltransferase [Paenibacillus polymyxa]AOK92250.1 GNAT family acetyltransferase [Paenibacillus polymyxa]KYG96600.1 GNAT family acetyltransferase [Paenibacillus polymyxa]MDY7990874.1 GNAT family N-acetyltransferase [Paenibacillus polymyxa]MDY8117312.1 GNAT family N-acetyltransferase [Paenibacillus polymyxa]
MKPFEYTSTLPRKKDFFSLYETTGWNSNGIYTPEILYRAICNSWYVITVYENDHLVGFGRILSDGVYQTFICDLIVHPDYQNKGMGRVILTQLLEKCKSSGIRWVQLSSAKDKRSFYKKFGFQERPADAPGMQLFFE